MTPLPSPARVREVRTAIAHGVLRRPGPLARARIDADAHFAGCRTGDAKLVEHTENDDFWGDGGDGSGRNELGRVLMAVREALRSEDEQ